MSFRRSKCGACGDLDCNLFFCFYFSPPEEIEVSAIFFNSTPLDEYLCMNRRINDGYMLLQGEHDFSEVTQIKEST